MRSRKAVAFFILIAVFFSIFSNYPDVSAASEMIPQAIEDWSDPEWVWNLEDLSAYARFTNLTTGQTRLVFADVDTDFGDSDCETGGHAVYTAVAVFEGQTFTDVQEVDLPAGHVWIPDVNDGEAFTEAIRHNEDCTEAWMLFRCARDEAHKATAPMTVENRRVEAQPTCETDGSISASVFISISMFPEGHSYSAGIRCPIPALGHDWQIEWEWANDGSYASACFVCARDASHTETLPAELTRTQMEDGSVECVASVSFNGQVYTDTKIVPPGHVHNYVAEGWDWSEDKGSASVHLVCTGDPSHTAYVEAAVTEVRTPATCTEDGYTTYTAVADYEGQTFSDIQVTAGTAALGHQYEVSSCDWETDYQRAYLHLECVRDPSHVVDLVADVETDFGTSSCEEGGEVTYTAKAVYEGKEYTSQKTVTVPAGHVWIPDVNDGEAFTEAIRHNEDCTEAWMLFRCARDGTHKESAPMRVENWRVEAQPTCETDGSISASVFISTSMFPEGQSYSAGIRCPIPALGHDWQTPEWIWAEDLSSASLTCTCSRDASHIRQFTDDDPALSVDDGTAVLTAETQYNGATYTDSKTVLSISETALRLPIGETAKLDAVSEKTVTWKVDREDVVSVDETGGITAVRPGSAVVTASILEDTDRPITLACTVKVEFTDVRNEKDYFYDPVYWAVENGITSGYTDSTGALTGLFGPDDSCTRAQIVTFLYRAAGSPAVDTSAATKFKDVKKSDYFYKAVVWAAQNNITTGYTDKNGKPTGYFGSNDKCTRGQIVTFLYRWKKEPAIDSSNLPAFKDVKKSDYFYKAVVWAAQNNITTGYSKTKFAPNDTCLRGQVVTFLYRAR